eukprot:CAMPEP_0170251858 /NCGR_PEP_ID=MMETSP0116_2-20130129/25761_1 /TAXON_ID=400756 /ORGANISM="Durinskia baltica, Strain CSIRO CS-38" /LENGTH=352 /DNA_ID=CAMNT_0010502825 /DNA_START=42 /DNA_END=1098 /DNA_ORIENTATION=-
MIEPRRIWAHVLHMCKQSAGSWDVHMPCVVLRGVVIAAIGDKWIDATVPLVRRLGRRRRCLAGFEHAVQEVRCRMVSEELRELAAWIRGPSSAPALGGATPSMFSKPTAVAKSFRPMPPVSGAAVARRNHFVGVPTLAVMPKLRPLTPFTIPTAPAALGPLLPKAGRRGLRGGIDRPFRLRASASASRGAHAAGNRKRRRESPWVFCRARPMAMARRGRKAATPAVPIWPTTSGALRGLAVAAPLTATAGSPPQPFSECALQLSEYVRRCFGNLRASAGAASPSTVPLSGTGNERRAVDTKLVEVKCARDQRFEAQIVVGTRPRRPIVRTRFRKPLLVMDSLVRLRGSPLLL